MDIREYLFKTRSFFFPHVKNDNSFSVIVSNVINRLEFNFKPPATLMNLRRDEAHIWFLLQVQYVIWSVSDESQSIAMMKEQNHDAFQLLSCLNSLFNINEFCPFLERGCIFKTMIPRKETSSFATVKNKLRSGKASIFADMNDEFDVGIYIERIDEIVYLPRKDLKAEKRNHNPNGCRVLALEPLTSSKRFVQNLVKIAAAFFFCEDCCSCGLYVLGKSSDQRRNIDEIRYVKRFVDTFMYIHKKTPSEESEETIYFDRTKFFPKFPANSNEEERLVSSLLKLDRNLLVSSKYLKFFDAKRQCNSDSVSSPKRVKLSSSHADCENESTVSTQEYLLPSHQHTLTPIRLMTETIGVTSNNYVVKTPNPSMTPPPFSPTGELPSGYRLLEANEDENTIETLFDHNSRSPSQQHSSPKKVENSDETETKLVTLTEETPGANLDESQESYDMVTKLV